MKTIRHICKTHKMVRDLFKSIKEGNHPPLIGIEITPKQYKMLALYVNDKDYLDTLRSRIASKSMPFL
jgi:hypothetical protein